MAHNGKGMSQTNRHAKVSYSYKIQIQENADMLEFKFDWENIFEVEVFEVYKYIHTHIHPQVQTDIESVAAASQDHTKVHE